MEQQRTEEWFEKRRGRITGSNVGAILGLSKFMKPEDVMRNMVRDWHNYPTEFKGNVATDYGTYNEPIAITDYEQETKNTVIATGFHEYDTWLGASPDGLVDEDGLIEVKCPYGMRDKNPTEFISIDYQTGYFSQVQMQLHVTNRQWCHFYQWSAHGYMIEKVWYNPLYIDNILPKLEVFYEKFLIEREAPACLKYLEDKRQQLNCEAMVELYLEVSKQIKEFEVEKKRILDEIIKLADGKDSEINGHKLTKVHRDGAISYAKAIKELLPDADLTKYTGEPSSYWRLS